MERKWEMCLVYPVGILPITTAKPLVHVQYSTASLELIPAAPEDESTIGNLLELCAHDFSEFHQVELDANGRFGYNRLPLYWIEPGRYPFLIKVDGRLAGLVLIKRGSEISDDQAVWDVGEFFVVRAYRRRGIGMNIAHNLWKSFPGRWEVRVMQSNCAALKFWQHAIATYTGGEIRPALFKKNGDCWRVFAFEGERAIN
jgi:predicted acetyltransferase